MVKTLLGQVKQYKKASILTPIMAVLEVVMETLLPIMMAKIIDNGINAGDMKKVCMYGGAMVLMALASLTLGILAGHFAAEASTGFACNLRESMYENIQKFSFANIDKYSTSGLITRLTTDVTNVQNSYQMILRMAVRAPMSLICALVMALIINAKLTGIFLVAMLVLLVAMITIMKTTIPLFQRGFRMYDSLNESVQENVSAIRVVKSFVREDYESEKFGKAADRIYELFSRAELHLAFVQPVMMFAVFGCMLGLSWLGGRMIVFGDLTTGNLTSLFTYVMGIMMSLMMLSMIFVMISMSLASMQRIVEVLEERSDLTNPEDPVYEVADGSVVFDQVSFAYKNEKLREIEPGLLFAEKKDAKKKKEDPANEQEGQTVSQAEGSDSEEGTKLGKAVLQNISFRVEAGETIGIIGATGSAKSSLVNLISRLYDVTEGRVLVGGRDVREYDLDTLRNEVAVVLQKNVLFSGTILDNLRWGDPNATEEECIRVCKLTCAHEFVMARENGYQTYIEQGGANVSGGQRQRLCIARALLKKPKILILDDSTSAVDTATDSKIRKAFREEIPGTTKFIIAQRISSVQDADRILVMDNGQINGFGTHEELLATNEIYREVYESQTKGGGDFDQKGGEQ